MMEADDRGARQAAQRDRHRRSRMIGEYGRAVEDARDKMLERIRKRDPDLAAELAPVEAKASAVMPEAEVAKPRRRTKPAKA